MTDLHLLGNVFMIYVAHREVQGCRKLREKSDEIMCSPQRPATIIALNDPQPPPPHTFFYYHTRYLCHFVRCAVPFVAYVYKIIQKHNFAMLNSQKFPQTKSRLSVLCIYGLYIQSLSNQSFIPFLLITQHTKNKITSMLLKCIYHSHNNLTITFPINE